METDLTALIVLGAALALPVSASSWKVQFFYDEDKSSLELRDLQCPSPSICIAAGFRSEQNKEKPRGTVLTTSDGGNHWSQVEVKEIPYSLFFLNDSLGWMVTDKGVWQTDESGRSWRKLKAIKGFERVWFLDPSHGFAAGERKAIYESTDGGKEWTNRPVADAFPMDPHDTVYQWITFNGTKHGVITGSWNPNHSAQQMAWQDPSRVPKGPMAAILVETEDGGQSWTELRIQVQGELTRVRFAKEPSILGLVEFSGTAQNPSEIYRMNLETHAATPIFHQTGLVARDFAVLPSGEVIVAAVQVMGKMADVPIPGKLKMMSSTSFETWLGEKVDYRAVSRQPIIAVADSNNVWVATDTGMIMKRVP